MYIRIIMTRKFGKHLHTEQLFRHYGVYINSAQRDLHHWRSNRQPLYAEAETLPLGHRFMSHITNYAELTSCDDNARPLDLMCLEGTYSLQRTRSPSGLRLPKSVLWIHITSTSWAGNGIILCLNGGIRCYILELSCSVCRMSAFAGFSSHDNSNI